MHEDYTTPLISNLQRFSVDDGPGIRTTVFFKGCNLRCDWCHNPECIRPGPSLQFLKDSCNCCGRCVQVCPNGCHHISEDGVHTIDRERCSGCGDCAYRCFNSALARIGKAYTPEELVNLVLKDRAYFDKSGGGVTYSGGDPMLFPDYLARVLAESKRQDLHTAVDTAGHVPFSAFEKMMPHTDLFLYDIKLWDAEKHRRATGVFNGLIRENLQRLAKAGAAIAVRVPVIMGYNEDAECLANIAGFLQEAGDAVQQVQLLPYHSYGVGKYDTLGLDSPTVRLAPPPQELMEWALDLFLSRKLPAVIS